MKVMAFLLVSAVALLVHSAVAVPAAATPRPGSGNLDEIIHTAQKYNKSLTKELYVEDVEALVSDGCKNEFFCKVHDILIKHLPLGQRRNQEEAIVRNLDQFLRGLNPNCTVLLNATATSNLKKPMPILLDNLVTCIRKRNLIGAK